MKEFFPNVCKNWAGNMYDWNCSYTPLYKREVWGKEEQHYPILEDALTVVKIDNVANYRFSFLQWKSKWDGLDWNESCYVLPSSMLCTPWNVPLRPL